jgi:hypothetical protein
LFYFLRVGKTAVRPLAPNLDAPIVFEVCTGQPGGTLTILFSL